MADSSTTYYNFTLPEVGGSADTWGTKLNANWTAIDGNLNTLNGAKCAEASNLSDLASAFTARTNLSLGGATVLNVGTQNAMGITVIGGDIQACFKYGIYVAGGQVFVNGMSFQNQAFISGSAIIHQIANGGADSTAWGARAQAAIHPWSMCAQKGRFFAEPRALLFASPGRRSTPRPRPGCPIMPTLSGTSFTARPGSKQGREEAHLYVRGGGGEWSNRADVR